MSLAYYSKAHVSFTESMGNGRALRGPRGPESASSGGACAARAGRCQALQETRSPVRSTAGRQLRRCPPPGTAEAAGPPTRRICRGAVLAVRPPDGRNRGTGLGDAARYSSPPGCLGAAQPAGSPLPLPSAPRLGSCSSARSRPPSYPGQSGPAHTPGTANRRRPRRHSQPAAAGAHTRPRGDRESDPSAGSGAEPRVAVRGVRLPRDAVAGRAARRARPCPRNV